MSNYVILSPAAGKAFCILAKVEKMKEPQEIIQGVKLEPWSSNVKFHMDPNFPKAIQLPDCVSNSANAIVVSKRFKDLIEGAEPANVEYLPITIVDHKGKVASAEYFIVNPYHLQDCIDQENSVLDWNDIDPDFIVICKKLVLDEKKITAGSKIFRLKHFPFKPLFERKLADKAIAAGMTGIAFKEIK